jgi:hypothetical protein
MDAANSPETVQPLLHTTEETSLYNFGLIFATENTSDVKMCSSGVRVLSKRVLHSFAFLIGHDDN